MYTYHLNYVGQATVDSMLSNPMITWVIAQIRRAENTQQVAVRIGNGSLSIRRETDNVLLCTHSLQLVSRLTVQTSSIFYCVKDQNQPLLVCHLFESSDPHTTESRYHVLVEMPTFSSTQVEAWFFKIHAVFRRYYVTSERDRKAQMLNALPCDVFAEVSDYFDFDPPRPGQFMQIVQKILNMYAPSERTRKKQEIEELVRRVSLDKPESEIFFPARTKCGQLLPRKVLPRSPNWVLMFGQLRYPNPSVRMSQPIKLRPFSKKLPEIWFFQTRLMFRMEEVTCEEDKYLDIVACLPDDVIHYVTDILEDPPERPYVTLVARLFYLYAPKLEESERCKWLTEDRMNMKFKDEEEVNAILEAFREFRRLHPPKETHLSVLPPTTEDDSKFNQPDLGKHVFCRFHYRRGCHASKCTPPCNWDRLFQREEDLGNYHPNLRKTIEREPRSPFFICRYHHKWGTKAQKCTDICNWEKMFGSKENPAQPSSTSNS